MGEDIRSSSKIVGADITYTKELEISYMLRKDGAFYFIGSRPK